MNDELTQHEQVLMDSLWLSMTLTQARIDIYTLLANEDHTLSKIIKQLATILDDVYYQADKYEVHLPKDFDLKLCKRIGIEYLFHQAVKEHMS